MLSFQPRLNNQLSLSRKLHSVAFKGQQKARFAHTHLFVSDDAAATPLPKHQWVGIDQKQHKEKYVWALIGLQWQRHHCIGCGVFIWCLSLHRSCKSCLTWKLSCQRWFTILIKKHTHTHNYGSETQQCSGNQSHWHHYSCWCRSRRWRLIQFCGHTASLNPFPNNLSLFLCFFFSVEAATALCLFNCRSTSRPLSSLNHPPKQTSIDASANIKHNASCVAGAFFSSWENHKWHSVLRTANMKTVISYMA